MSADDFKAWQAHMGWSSAETARRLGVSSDTITRYRHRGVPKRLGRLVGFACSAVAHGLPVWKRVEAGR